ncbi:unnamed protein product [Urochloa decumbens]|uniref:Uncharacterized protein n=1 Tax=Urochloa decumbens TaxID=240449 RepID=A0ABC9B4X1_9POAL
MASKLPPAALLLATTLLLFAAASTLAEAPAALEPDEDPKCPGRHVDELIVAIATAKSQSVETLEILGRDKLYPEQLADCICSRVVGATGVDVRHASPGSIDEFVKLVVRAIQRRPASYPVSYICFPELDFNPPGAVIGMQVFNA